MSEEAKREEAEAKPQPMDSETSYINQPVTARELRDLAKLAAVEEKAFFVRNPHLSKPYQQRLLLVALCQGAALQYLGCGHGVKDFDVHFFYAQNPEKKKLSRPTKEVYASGQSHQKLRFVIGLCYIFCVFFDGAGARLLSPSPGTFPHGTFG